MLGAPTTPPPTGFQYWDRAAVACKYMHATAAILPLTAIISSPTHWRKSSACVRSCEGQAGDLCACTHALATCNGVVERLAQSSTIRVGSPTPCATPSPTEPRPAYYHGHRAA